MKKTFFILASLFLFWAVSSFAQLKIGYVDSDTIIDNLPDMQDARQKLDGLIRDWQNELKNMQADYMKKKDDLDFNRHYVCRLKDSTEYAVGIATEDGKTFITCGAEFTDERPASIKKDESEEELKIKEAKLLADDKAKEFTIKHQGWVYEVPEYKAEHLTKELTDLIEDEAPIEIAEDPNTITSE